MEDDIKDIIIKDENLENEIKTALFFEEAEEIDYEPKDENNIPITVDGRAFLEIIDDKKGKWQSVEAYIADDSKQYYTNPYFTDINIESIIGYGYHKDAALEDLKNKLEWTYNRLGEYIEGIKKILYGDK